MKRIVSYRTAGSNGWRAGVNVGGLILDAGELVGKPSAFTTRQLLTDDLVSAVVEAAGRERHRPVANPEIGPPVPDAEKIICVGLNYRDHAAESELALPSVPVLFVKFPTCLVGPTADVPLPRQSRCIDYEGELAVVIGRRCKSVATAAALDHVVGYSVFNDVSARDLQMAVSQWTTGKAIDGFGPLGPGIALAADVGDPQSLWLTTRVNGEVVQSQSTASMVFSVAELVSYISQFITLVPGDIIATGTPAGVGHVRTPPRFLKPGDVVEVTIDRIGSIRNAMVAPDPEDQE